MRRLVGVVHGVLSTDGKGTKGDNEAKRRQQIESEKNQPNGHHFVGDEKFTIGGSSFVALAVFGIDVKWVV